MVYLDAPEPETCRIDRATLKKLAIVASIAAAVQYGWALQLSLLTPYTQLLGLNHRWASIIWLCGPVTGLIVQPVVGHTSDRCTSRFGRRRPFFVVGAILLCLGVMLIGFAADIGQFLGDSLAPGMKHRAIAVFVLGFWLLDVSNNTIQGPCRALLADISEGNDALVTIGNALFAFFMAVGNIIGYAAGAWVNIYQVLPFTKTEACAYYCANLKTCYLFSVVFVSSVVTYVVVVIKEERFDPSYIRINTENLYPDDDPPSLFGQIVIAARSQSKQMRILYFVTALNWIGSFPFLLYDTDWMGREIYGGNVMGSPEEISLYAQGMHAGSLGLVLNVVVLGAVSLFMECFLQFLGNARRVLAVGNAVLAICMGFTVLITKMAEDTRETALITQGSSIVPPSLGVQASCYALFASFGIPQAVTFSIPFALVSIYSRKSDIGQGLALGLLNLAIVIPQVSSITSLHVGRNCSSNGIDFHHKNAAC